MSKELKMKFEEVIDVPHYAPHYKYAVCVMENGEMRYGGAYHTFEKAEDECDIMVNNVAKNISCGFVLEIDKGRNVLKMLKFVEKNV